MDSECIVISDDEVELRPTPEPINDLSKASCIPEFIEVPSTSLPLYKKSEVDPFFETELPCNFIKISQNDLKKNVKKNDMVIKIDGTLNIKNFNAIMSVINLYAKDPRKIYFIKNSNPHQMLDLKEFKYPIKSVSNKVENVSSQSDKANVFALENKNNVKTNFNKPDQVTNISNLPAANPQNKCNSQHLDIINDSLRPFLEPACDEGNFPAISTQVNHNFQQLKSTFGALSPATTSTTSSTKLQGTNISNPSTENPQNKCSSHHLDIIDDSLRPFLEPACDEGNFPAISTQVNHNFQQLKSTFGALSPATTSTTSSTKLQSTNISNLSTENPQNKCSSHHLDIIDDSLRPFLEPACDEGNFPAISTQINHNFQQLKSTFGALSPTTTSTTSSIKLQGTNISNLSSGNPQNKCSSHHLDIIDDSPRPFLEPACDKGNFPDINTQINHNFQRLKATFEALSPATTSTKVSTKSQGAKSKTNCKNKKRKLTNEESYPVLLKQMQDGFRKILPSKEKYDLLYSAGIEKNEELNKQGCPKFQELGLNNVKHHSVTGTTTGQADQQAVYLQAQQLLSKKSQSLKLNEVAPSPLIAFLPPPLIATTMDNSYPQSTYSKTKGETIDLTNFEEVNTQLNYNFNRLSSTNDSSCSVIEKNFKSKQKVLNNSRPPNLIPRPALSTTVIKTNCEIINTSTNDNFNLLSCSESNINTTKDLTNLQGINLKSKHKFKYSATPLVAPHLVSTLMDKNILENTSNNDSFQKLSCTIAKSDLYFKKAIDQPKLHTSKSKIKHQFQYLEPGNVTVQQINSKTVESVVHDALQSNLNNVPSNANLMKLNSKTTEGQKGKTSNLTTKRKFQYMDSFNVMPNLQDKPGNDLFEQTSSICVTPFLGIRTINPMNVLSDPINKTITTQLDIQSNMKHGQEFIERIQVDSTSQIENNFNLQKIQTFAENFFSDVTRDIDRVKLEEIQQNANFLESHQELNSPDSLLKVFKTRFRSVLNMKRKKKRKRGRQPKLKVQTDIISNENKYNLKEVRISLSRFEVTDYFKKRKNIAKLKNDLLKVKKIFFDEVNFESMVPYFIGKPPPATDLYFVNKNNIVTSMYIQQFPEFKKAIKKEKIKITSEFANKGYQTLSPKTNSLDSIKAKEKAMKFCDFVFAFQSNQMSPFLKDVQLDHSYSVVIPIV